MSDQPLGCARTTGAVFGEQPTAGLDIEAIQPERGKTMIARVGQKAPDFEAPAYYQGAFTNIKLSRYLGKWVLLCFYPGDFTFV